MKSTAPQAGKCAHIWHNLRAPQAQSGKHSINQQQRQKVRSKLRKIHEFANKLRSFGEF